MSFNFAPKGWALADGQLLPINQNQPLFALLGTTYGGNGQTNFALPNLQGRVPLHRGQGLTIGEVTGEQNHTLTVSELPTHIHPANASTNGANANNPTGNLLANSPGNPYADPSQGSAAALTATTITSAGGGQSHSNQQPYLTLSFCIALTGIFPSQN